MKQHKFTGKNISDGKWVYGDLTQVGNKKYIINNGISDLQHYCQIINEVIPETVGQYIGKNDDDGKEIYEGDIVREYGGEYCQGYWEHDIKITITDIAKDCFMIGESEHVKLLGNVHGRLI